MPYGICPPGPAAPLLQARGPLLHVLQDALPPRTRRASGKRMTAPSAPLVTTAGQEPRRVPGPQLPPSEYTLSAGLS